MTDPAQACAWKYDDIDDYYATGCAEAQCFNDGGPTENNYRFCPYCGLKIEVQPCK